MSFIGTLLKEIVNGVDFLIIFFTLKIHQIFKIIKSLIEIVVLNEYLNHNAVSDVVMT